MTTFDPTANESNETPSVLMAGRFGSGRTMHPALLFCRAAQATCDADAPPSPEVLRLSRWRRAIVLVAALVVARVTEDIA